MHLRTRIPGRPNPGSMTGAELEIAAHADSPSQPTFAAS